MRFISVFSEGCWKDISACLLVGLLAWLVVCLLACMRLLVCVFSEGRCIDMLVKTSVVCVCVWKTWWFWRDRSFIKLCLIVTWDLRVGVRESEPWWFAILNAGQKSTWHWMVYVLTQGSGVVPIILCRKLEEMVDFQQIAMVRKLISLWWEASMKSPYYRKTRGRCDGRARQQNMPRGLTFSIALILATGGSKKNVENTSDTVLCSTVV